MTEQSEPPRETEANFAFRGALEPEFSRLRRALPPLPLPQNLGISHVITGLRTQWHFTQCVTCESRLG